MVAAFYKLLMERCGKHLSVESMTLLVEALEHYDSLYA
jgi:hypothetical protein